MKSIDPEGCGETARRLIKSRMLLALLLPLFCSGCTTALSHLFEGNGVYQGVRGDCSGIASGNPFLVIDLPLSAAADTLLLPYDATMRPPNPLGKDWRLKDETRHEKISMTIVEDYEDFTRKLNLKSPPSTQIFDDKSGRHAVQIAIDTGSNYIIYTLIYDKFNVRTKTVKWRALRIHM